MTAHALFPLGYIVLSLGLAGVAAHLRALVSQMRRP
jgi:hypothetical protein